MDVPLEQFLLTVGQNNFGNKIPFLQEAYENRLEIPEEEEDKWWFLGMGLVSIKGIQDSDQALFSVKLQ